MCVFVGVCVHACACRGGVCARCGWFLLWCYYVGCLKVLCCMLYHLSRYKEQGIIIVDENNFEEEIVNSQCTCVLVAAHWSGYVYMFSERVCGCACAFIAHAYLYRCACVPLPISLSLSLSLSRTPSLSLSRTPSLSLLCVCTCVGCVCACMCVRVCVCVRVYACVCVRAPRIV